MDEDAFSVKQAQRILVTGATGYLGSNLCRFLVREGATVCGLVRDGSDLSRLADLAGDNHFSTWRLDASGEALDACLRGFSPDAVVHTAAASNAGNTRQDIDRMLDCNVRLLSYLLLAMREQGVDRLVNIGSSWQTCTNVPYDPFNYYAATKQAAEAAIDVFVKEGLSCVTLRLFDTYGPDDWRNKIVCLLLRAMVAGQELGMSPGFQQVSLVHIEDVCRAIGLALDALDGGDESGHQRYNLLSERLVSLRELVALLDTLGPRPVPVVFGRREYRKNEIMLPDSPLPRLPGWREQISLEDGLRDVLRAMAAAGETPTA